MSTRLLTISSTNKESNSRGHNPGKFSILKGEIMKKGDFEITWDIQDTISIDNSSILENLQSVDIYADTDSVRIEEVNND